jgi:hypothetical protein
MTETTKRKTENTENMKNKELVTPIIVWKTASTRDKSDVRLTDLQPADIRPADVQPLDARSSTESGHGGNIISFPGQVGPSGAESTVTEWSFTSGQAARPVVIRIISSGFGEIRAMHTGSRSFATRPATWRYGGNAPHRTESPVLCRAA